MTTTPHKHAEVIKEWADGLDVEVLFNGAWHPEPYPKWDLQREYRVKQKKAIANNTAPEFLHRAATIMEERGKQYDKPGGERSMGKTVAAFNEITGRDLSEAEGWLLLETLKNVRLWQKPGFHQDSADDGVAYSALKAEAKAKEAGNV